MQVTVSLDKVLRMFAPASAEKVKEAAQPEKRVPMVDQVGTTCTARYVCPSGCHYHSINPHSDALHHNS
jgi:radical SAM protein with 4Fe4S-binding SPASM domain